MTKIYTLSDPRDNSVRYIGKTVKTLEYRLNSHINESKRSDDTHKKRWIRSLLKIGLKPAIEMIEESDNSWQDLETYWIYQFLAWGFNLTNSTYGGEGLCGKIHTSFTKNKMRISAIKRERFPLTEEHKNAIKLALKGRTKTQSHLDNITMKLKGVKRPPRSQTTKDKISKTLSK